ncbi:hypothetical protein [Klebsiella pneumoniae]|uniref:hypothetical protein n=1 Tax=Klebsiella pneumoniae TaxID=573 RepID=UPI001D0DA62D|nr:hypothetical protein [Klebsiella pneumoniae]
MRELYFDKIKAIDPLSRQFWSSKPTEEGESDDFAAFAKTGFGKSGVLPTGSQRIETQLELFDEIWKRV